MDSSLLLIQHSDSLWIAIAFVCGMLIRRLGLPPLVGFLVAGFLLNALGAKSGELLEGLADLGITLLLFTIGLKLKLRSLARPEVWGTASLHMCLSTVLVAGFLILLSYTSLSLVSDVTAKTAVLIGFALSFSSTVFAVKVLEEMGATNARHGQVAIGLLVVQDIAAVVFIAVSMGKLPSPWAIGLLALIPIRMLFLYVLSRVEHGELLVLFGIVMALLGADVFEMVDIKADVGALVFGMLLAGHPKANELAKSLLSLKELFLIGFFLSVGMTAMPGWGEVLMALLLLVILPIKVAMYFGLFNLFKLRASTSWRSALNLANYSEFSLIVGAIAVSAGWLSSEWLSVFAVAMSISFVVSAPVVNIRDELYQKWRYWLNRLERRQRLSGEENLDLSGVKVMVFGMGRMGTAAYNAMADDYQKFLVGVELDPDRVSQHQEVGRTVVVGDATNPDFWMRVPGLFASLEYVLLTLPTQKANVDAVHRLKEMHFKGRIAAISKFPDEEEALKAIGVEHTFNIYTEAGVGFAKELQGFVGSGRYVAS